MTGDEMIYETVAAIETDALIDALAAGDYVDDDALSTRLSAWREELELATPRPPLVAPGPATPVVVLRPHAPHRRLSRGAVAAMSAFALVAGGGVAAAAASGPHGPLGPLHRMLFGDSSSSTEQRPTLGPTAGTELVPATTAPASSTPTGPTADPTRATTRPAGAVSATAPGTLSRRTEDSGDGVSNRGDGDGRGEDDGSSPDSGSGSRSDSGGGDGADSSTAAPTPSPTEPSSGDSAEAAGSGSDGASSAENSSSTIGGDDG
jgi:hypothetical protein